MSDQLVYVRSAVSRVHVAVMHSNGSGRQLYSNERCNLDDLDRATREVLDELPPDLGPEHLCRRCFPDVVVQGQGETATIA